MRKVKWGAAAALIGGCTLLMQPGYAQFAGLSNPLSKGAKSDAAPAGDPEKSLTALNVRFAVAMREMLTAEAFTLEALGDKAKADQLSETAKSLDGKSDVGTISKSIQVSNDAAKEIKDKTAASAVIDAHAKGLLLQAVPHYAVGMVQMIQMPAEYQKWIAGAKSSANGGVLGGVRLAGEIADVVSMTAHLPDLLSVWGDTTKNFVKFSKGNGVDTSDLSSKI
jgi:hypothetical protein